MADGGGGITVAVSDGKVRKLVIPTGGSFALPTAW